MQTRNVNGITLYFDASEQAAADLFAEACKRSIPLIQEQWGFPLPRECRVYVMTSRLHFIFHSAPWSAKIAYAISLPVWYFRTYRQWQYIGGWTLRYRQRPSVGVKPPALFELADKSIGQRVYVREPDIHKRVQATLCHELVHAFSAHLQLPLWLNEGIAMLTTDRFAGSPTVRIDTLDTLAKYPHKSKSANYVNLASMDADRIVYNYVRGYWLTRYLEEAHPGTVRSLLAIRRSARNIEEWVSDTLKLPRKKLWVEIDPLIAAHYAHMEK